MLFERGGFQIDKLVDYRHVPSPFLRAGLTPAPNKKMAPNLLSSQLNLAVQHPRTKKALHGYPWLTETPHSTTRAKRPALRHMKEGRLQTATCNVRAAAPRLFYNGNTRRGLLYVHALRAENTNVGGPTTHPAFGRAARKGINVRSAGFFQPGNPSPGGFCLHVAVFVSICVSSDEAEVI